MILKVLLDQPHNGCPLFFELYRCILYLPLRPQVHGRKLLQHWRASREFHPSEDLSELPPWREAVAGQESHYH